MEWISTIICLLILAIALIYKQGSGRQSTVINDLIDQNATLKIAAGRSEEKVKLLKEEKGRLLEEVKAERTKHFELSKSNEGLKSYYQSREEKIREQKEEIENLQKKLTAEFENIAEKLLKEKSIEFTEKKPDQS